MELLLTSQAPETIDTEAVAMVIFEKSDGEEPFRRLDQLLGGLLGDLFASGEATGKALDTTLIHRPQGFAARRLLLVGGGQAEKFDTAPLRRAAGTALRTLKSKG